MSRKKKSEPQEMELEKQVEEEDAPEVIDEFEKPDEEEPEVEPSDDDLANMKDLEEFGDIIEKRTAGKGRKASSKDEYDDEDFEEFDDFGEDDEEFEGKDIFDDEV